MTMKYIFLVVLALIILRIDMFVGVVERAWQKIPQSSKEETVEPFEVPSVSTLAVSNFQQNQTNQFQLLLEEFGYHPDRPTRDLVREFLRTNSNVSDISPQNLFSGLEKWSSHVASENPEVLLLLNELMDVFRGENYKVLQQFYSNYLDQSPEIFFHYYPVSKDPNCIVAKYTWNNSNFLDQDSLKSRYEKIEQVSAKIDPMKLEFSKNCLLVIRVEFSKATQPSETP